MKLNKFIFVALAAASLSSCGVYKNYERPAEIKADGIYGDAQDGSRSMGELKWREVFTDPTLQALIEKGLMTAPENGIGAEGCWLALRK